ncbi:MAG: hypothetical protein RLZ84_438 [Actinomycetota bacterium]
MMKHDGHPLIGELKTPASCWRDVENPNHETADNESPVGADDRQAVDDFVQLDCVKNAVDDSDDCSQQKCEQQQCSECVHGDSFPISAGGGLHVGKYAYPVEKVWISDGILVE